MSEATHYYIPAGKNKWVARKGDLRVVVEQDSDTFFYTIHYRHYTYNKNNGCTGSSMEELNGECHKDEFAEEIREKIYSIRRTPFKGKAKFGYPDNVISVSKSREPILNEDEETVIVTVVTSKLGNISAKTYPNKTIFYINDAEVGVYGGGLEPTFIRGMQKALIAFSHLGDKDKGWWPFKRAFDMGAIRVRRNR